ncbi:hypothetical protein E2C01_078432 [Portunus trituberculatus]|uniref:Uncharacterized protein n=1 Tax=Portunus trituberculatus TaxID=210409 RepID=A0A5B7IQ48_PORTR|nr:hypothetical protein [Portunus trituberculatus]
MPRKALHRHVPPHLEAAMEDCPLLDYTDLVMMHDKQTGRAWSVQTHYVSRTHCFFPRTLINQLIKFRPRPGSGPDLLNWP